MEWRQIDDIANVRARAVPGEYTLTAEKTSDVNDDSDSSATKERNRNADINHIKSNEHFLCAPTKPKHFLDENPIAPDYMLNDNEENQQLMMASHKSSSVAAGTSNQQQECDQTNSRSTNANTVNEDLLYFPQPSYTVYRMVKNEMKATCSVTTTTTTTNAIAKHLLPKTSMEAWGENGDMRFHNIMGSIAAAASSRSGSSSALGLNLPDEVESVDSKVECVYSLLSMLGSNDPLEMSMKFVELSRTPETCCALRRAGCIPLLVQMIHSENKENVAAQAGIALQNVVHHHPDEKSGRRELKILRLLEQIVSYCNFLRTLLQSGGEAIADDSDRHPLAAISSLMKVSFDEEHRHSMCELGALQVIPNLVHLDHAVHGPKAEDQCCNSLRRYALMALTNLTFGDENNKALLCSQRTFMEALVSQLDAAPDDLLQVTASVLRNLSWRADRNMKTILNEIGTVTALTRAAMKNRNENTLKAILSALWNLSAHCSMNKAEFCAVDGALAFLIGMLTYEGPSKTLKIIENAGGILRNVSSHIAVRENYRKILREYNCLAILLQQLKSESLTVVSNSCGTLWNLSARCPEDQKFLWDNGAVPMLRSLINSKHDMISEGSSSALKNLLNFRPSLQNQNHLDPIARSMGLRKLPSLNVRKQKALEQELEKTEHTETCENLDVEQRERKTNKEQSNANGNERDDEECDNNDHDDVDENNTAIGHHRSRARSLPKSKSRDSLFCHRTSELATETLIRSSSASDECRVRGSTSNTSNGNRATTVEEQPIDYAAKYNEHDAEEVEIDSNATYQETDHDQLTDFSLRYAENHTDHLDSPNKQQNVANNVHSANNHNEDSGNEVGGTVLLVLEDSVMCYQTEDTPYVISNATSVTDLTAASKIEASTAVVTNSTTASTTASTTTTTTTTVALSKIQHNTSTSGGAKFSFTKAEVVIPRTSRRPMMAPSSGNPNKTVNKDARAAYSASGSHTPEKPINYCEEGTPGYFSRHESLSSLDEEPQIGGVQTAISTDEATAASFEVSEAFIEPIQQQQQHQQGLRSEISNSALETPLMFSRHSSMDSLVQPGEVDGDESNNNNNAGQDDDDDDIINRHYDDKSSVVSEFSRLASGVISPSEIPDSPTQSMPPSPRRLITMTTNTDHMKSDTGGGQLRSPRQLGAISRTSVFEDHFNTFNVENTPAQFSCATSLSNLSFFDEEQQHVAKSIGTGNNIVQLTGTNNISEGEEDDEPLPGQSDDMLLASCIDIGMNRPIINNNNNNSNVIYSQSPRANVESTSSERRFVVGENGAECLGKGDETRPYYTENTPAVFSNLGSNSNLSAISIYSTINESTGDIRNVNGNDNGINTNCATSTVAKNLTNTNEYDDVSSNASECGEANQSTDLLQQCIRDGMKKSIPRPNNTLGAVAQTGRESTFDTKFLRTLEFPSSDHHSTVTNGHFQVRLTKDHKSLNDSLSSLSNDSDDDTNLLSQAIAAGCNRPKSNLGFTTTTLLNKRSNSLSASQPIPVNDLLLNSMGSMRQRQQERSNIDPYSSVESSDSNDNQSKSLLELCIRSGMHKKGRANGSGNNTTTMMHNYMIPNRKVSNPVGDWIATPQTTQSNPNLLRVDQSRHKKGIATISKKAQERESNDERLLQECINTGISKKVSSSSTSRTINPNMKSQCDDNDNRHTVPKNLQTSSAAYHQHNLLHHHHHRQEAGALLLQPSTQHQQQQSIATTFHPQQQQTEASDVAKNSNNNSRIVVVRNVGNANIALMTQTEMAAAAVVVPAVAAAGEGEQHETQGKRKNHNEMAMEDNSKYNSNRNQDVNCHEVVMMVNHDYTVKLEQEDQMGIDIGCEVTTTLPSIMNSESFIIMDPPSMLATIINEDANIDRSTTVIQQNRDPNLVMRCVERLTKEFVTSAEQMRMHNYNDNGIVSSSSNTNGSCGKTLRHPLNDASVADSDCTVTSTTTTPNTWNENTCPNDVSFPSISMTPPAAIKSMGSSSMDATDGIENSSTSSSGIMFQLGGAVHSAALTTHPSISSEDSAVGRKALQHQMLLTNSILIEREAEVLANNLQKLQFDDISLNYDLNNVAPPSGIESLNLGYSGHFDDLNYSSLPQSSENGVILPTKDFLGGMSLLPPGFVARRALGHQTGQRVPPLGGSNDSLNISSMNFLENVKPPSVMDDLLDSMMSVDSIQSEIADCESMTTTISASNYRTADCGVDAVVAIPDFDDGTITLCSCLMDNDDEHTMHSGGSNTPLQSDYSSFECLPPPIEEDVVSSQQRSPLNPKQKRSLTKDRFKTYIIKSTDLQISCSAPTSPAKKALNGNASIKNVMTPQLSNQYQIAGIKREGSSTKINTLNGLKIPKPKTPEKMQSIYKTPPTSRLVPKSSPCTSSPRAPSSLSPSCSPIKHSISQSSIKKVNENGIDVEMETYTAIAVTTATSPPELKREGTFVKEAADVAPANVPVVEHVSPTHKHQISAPATASPKKKIPGSGTKMAQTPKYAKRSTAAKTFIQPSLSPSKRIASTTAVTVKNASSKIAQSIKSAVMTPKRSNTTITPQTMRKTSLPLSRVSTTTPPSRSNSNLGSNASSSNNNNNNPNGTQIIINRTNSIPKPTPIRIPAYSKPLSKQITTTNKIKMTATSTDVVKLSSATKTPLHKSNIAGNGAKILIPVKPTNGTPRPNTVLSRTSKINGMAPTSPSKIAISKRK